jgi:hypothetical protein
MGEDQDKDAKLLAFSPPVAKPFTLRRDRETTAGECPHVNVEIRQRPRRLRCVDCRSLVDPFEYVLRLAEEWERLFPKNEAARKLETALHDVLAAHGSVTITDGGVTARQLTKAGARLEAHESWGVHAWNGGTASAIIAAVKKLGSQVARWGNGDLAYPRFTIVKTRGVKSWTVGVLNEGGSWRKVDERSSLDAAYDLAQEEAHRLGKPFILEDRPRSLWR